MRAAVAAGLIALGALLGGAAAGAEPGVDVYRVTERAPLALALYYSTEGSVRTGDVSALLEAFDQALEARTRLRRVRGDDGAAARCQATPAEWDVCLVSTFFPDFEPHRRPDRRAGPEVVARISAADLGTRRVVRAVAFDAPAALEEMAAAATELGGAPSPLVLQGALSAVARSAELERAGDLDRSDLYARLLDALEIPARHPRMGRLVLSGVPRGALLTVGGRTFGPVTATRVRIEGLEDGAYTLGVAHPDYTEMPPVRFEVVAAGTVARRLDLMSLAGERRRIARSATVWTGAAVAAAGAGVMIASAFVQADQECFRVGGGPSCVDDPRFTRAGGVPLLPLGAALAGAGLTWAAGGLWWGEEDELPWVPWVVGAVLGGAALGVTWALEPG